MQPARNVSQTMQHATLGAFASLKNGVYETGRGIERAPPFWLPPVPGPYESLLPPEKKGAGRDASQYAFLSTSRASS